MLSNSLMSTVVHRMSEPNSSALIRKKSAKHPANSSRNSNHKLKKISSSTTYVVDFNDGGQENLNSISGERSAISACNKSGARFHRNIDKTTSSTSISGKKYWNLSPKPASIRISNSNAIKEESELIGVLTEQLYLAEAQMQRAQSTLRKNEEQLKSKEQEIGRLKRKVKDWEAKSRNQETLRKKEQQQRRRQIDHSEYLHKRCLMLEQRIFEMEKFLADYGLVWVGDTSDNSKGPENASNNYIETCYEQIAANIDQLNLAAGKDEVHIQHNEKGSGAAFKVILTFKSPPCMPLKFYKNGMIVQESPLRPYNDPATLSFLRDILDGYFPSELQQAYPKGVPFKVEDHRTQTFVRDSAGFPGQGYRLGNQPPADNALLSTGIRKSSITPPISGRRGLVPKDMASNFNFAAALLPPTARSLKTRSPSAGPSSEICMLRSQILASHNNVCSATHLQSHINAELGLSSRREKRDLATKNAECDLSTRERTSKTGGAPRQPSRGRCYHSSTDRSSRLSPSRWEHTGDRSRQRSKSASLSGTRLNANSRSTSRVKVPKGTSGIDFSKASNHSSRCSTPKGHRASKSAPQTRKLAPPILHQINEPSGETGELRLKVRSLNGGTVYLVHVSADESVAKLYQLLDRTMSALVPRGYKIVLSGYSPRRLEQLGASLRESGITRDSVLHLVND